MGAFLQELFHTALYKRTQGRIVRQVTFAACALIVALGCWALSYELDGVGPTWVSYTVPLVLLLAGTWACFRLVHMPQFADFLISVEAEMNKVTWPKRRELINASIVVMVVIFALAFLLFGFDLTLKGLQIVFQKGVGWIASWMSGGSGGDPTP